MLGIGVAASLAMASQTHDTARAAGSARRGEYAHFEHKLRGRWCKLRDETREALTRSDNEGYADIAGRVTDLEDQSLADLLVDVNLAEVTRDVQEIRAIEGALKPAIENAFALSFLRAFRVAMFVAAALAVASAVCAALTIPKTSHNGVRPPERPNPSCR